MKTGREVLAALLTGNAAALQQYKNEKDACYILAIEGAQAVGFCIYPDLSVREVEADLIRGKLTKKGNSINVGFTDSKLTFPEFKADVLSNPKKYYRPRKVTQRVFFAND